MSVTTTTDTTPPPFEIWYRVSNYENAHLEIREVRVCRSTEESVWELHAPYFKGHNFVQKREKRASQSESYFPTYTEAHDHLKKRALKMKERAEELLGWANKFLEGPNRIRKCEPFPTVRDKPNFDTLV